MKVDPIKKARAERLLKEGNSRLHVQRVTGLAKNTVGRIAKAVAAETKRPDESNGGPRPS